MRKFWKVGRWVLLGAVAVVLVVISLMKTPIPVDVAAVSRGHMIVAVEAEGVTRVRDRYVVAAPVSGRLKRTDLEEGDLVRKGDLLTTVYPAPVNAAQRQEIESNIDALEASQRRAEAELKALVEQLTQARRESDRMDNLYDEGAVSKQQLEQANLQVSQLEQQISAAEQAVQAAEAQANAAKSGRAAYYGGDHEGIPIRSPADGSVLRISEESERVVMAGTPIMIVGDPKGLEIVVDVLSTDAVSIQPGDRILVDGWGGEDTLEGLVRYIEPSAFTKYSALGIEEQRVNVIGMFQKYPELLGDGYRVIARIVTWEGSDVLQIPASALFRAGADQWAVFTIRHGTASRELVKVGHRNTMTVEILDGLSADDEVILHPPNDVEDGSSVKSR
jgi:HlyD family secretion protein